MLHWGLIYFHFYLPFFMDYFNFLLYCLIISFACLFIFVHFLNIFWVLYSLFEQMWNSKSITARLVILWNKNGHFYCNSTNFVGSNFILWKFLWNFPWVVFYNIVSSFIPTILSLDRYKADQTGFLKSWSLMHLPTAIVFLLLFLTQKYSHSTWHLSVFILLRLQAEFVTLWSKHWVSWPG